MNRRRARWVVLGHASLTDPFPWDYPGVPVPMAPSDRHNPARTKTSRVVNVVIRRPR